jgi:hypothetical protein
MPHVACTLWPVPRAVWCRGSALALHPQFYYCAALVFHSQHYRALLFAYIHTLIQEELLEGGQPLEPLLSEMEMYRARAQESFAYVFSSEHTTLARRTEGPNDRAIAELGGAPAASASASASDAAAAGAGDSGGGGLTVVQPPTVYGLSPPPPVTDGEPGSPAGGNHEGGGGQVSQSKSCTVQ